MDVFTRLKGSGGKCEIISPITSERFADTSSTLSIGVKCGTVFKTSGFYIMISLIARTACAKRSSSDFE